MPDIAISATSSQTSVLTQRLLEGTFDLAVMYQPGPPPGLSLDHLFDEEFVLVTSTPGRPAGLHRLRLRRLGAGLSADHTTAFPELAHSG